MGLRAMVIALHQQYCNPRYVTGMYWASLGIFVMLWLLHGR